MAKLYGITKTFITPHVIGYGKRCVVWNCYFYRKDGRRRFRMYFYKIDTPKVLFHMVHNSDRFWFIGYLSASMEEIE